eukprot:jgi/Tetstr1/432789/TSEL_022141.t1
MATRHDSALPPPQTAWSPPLPTGRVRQTGRPYCVEKAAEAGGEIRGGVREPVVNRSHTSATGAEASERPSAAGVDSLAGWDDINSMLKRRGYPELDLSASSGTFGNQVVATVASLLLNGDVGRSAKPVAPESIAAAHNRKAVCSTSAGSCQSYAADGVAQNFQGGVEGDEGSSVPPHSAAEELEAENAALRKQLKQMQEISQSKEILMDQLRGVAQQCVAKQERAERRLAAAKRQLKQLATADAVHEDSPGRAPPESEVSPSKREDAQVALTTAETQLHEMAARVRRLEQEALSAEDRLAAAERNGWQVPNEGDIQVLLLSLERDLAESRRQLSIHDAASRHCIQELTERCRLLEEERQTLAASLRGALKDAAAVRALPPAAERRLGALEDCLAECCSLVFCQGAEFTGCGGEEADIGEADVYERAAALPSALRRWLLMLDELADARDLQRSLCGQLGLAAPADGKGLASPRRVLAAVQALLELEDATAQAAAARDGPAGIVAALQRMFGCSTMEGMPACMSKVCMDLEEGKNLRRQLGSVLGLGSYPSAEGIMSVVRSLLTRRSRMPPP